MFDNITIELICVHSGDAISEFSTTLYYNPDPDAPIKDITPSGLSNKTVWRNMGPGMGCKMPIPRNKLQRESDGEGWRYVAPGDRALSWIGYGEVGIVVHGNPYNLYQGKDYTGPLYQIRVHVDAEGRDWETANGLPNTPAQNYKGAVKLEAATDGSALITTGTATLLHGSFQKLQATEGELSDVIGAAVLNVADVIATVLPFPFNYAVQGITFFVRAVTGITLQSGENAETALLLYDSYSDALNDKRIKVTQEALALTTKELQLVAINGEPKGPLPTFQRSPYNLLTGDVIRVVSTVSNFSWQKDEFAYNKNDVWVNCGGKDGISDTILTFDHLTLGATVETTLDQLKINGQPLPVGTPGFSQHILCVESSVASSTDTLPLPYLPLSGAVIMDTDNPVPEIPPDGGFAYWHLSPSLGNKSAISCRELYYGKSAALGPTWWMALSETGASEMLAAEADGYKTVTVFGMVAGTASATVEQNPTKRNVVKQPIPF